MPVHESHTHNHGANCSHTAVEHDGHIDYLHDGHLHHPEGQNFEEHRIGITGQNPAPCTPEHDCGSHEAAHRHDAHCGHEQVPHGDHIDYLVAGHLHHPHGDHCDDHGTVDLARK